MLLTSVRVVVVVQRVLVCVPRALECVRSVLEQSTFLESRLVPRAFFSLGPGMHPAAPPPAPPQSSSSSSMPCHLRWPRSPALKTPSTQQNPSHPLLSQTDKLLMLLVLLCLLSVPPVPREPATRRVTEATPPDMVFSSPSTKPQPQHSPPAGVE